MNKRPLIDILLATWNGERYLAEQIESLLAQTSTDWRLLARDDGSTDGTTDILGRYAALHRECITIVEDSDAGLGACGNFARLMEHSDAEYVMFCDQDDVWLPEKVEHCLNAIRKLEKEQEPGKPALVHCDLRVVDPDIETIAPSFWRYQKLNPVKGRFLNRLLIQNVVTGCAAILNRPLARLATPIPAGARMHDWWIALVAAAFGNVGYLPESLVLYRQHGGNTLGAKGWSLRTVARMLAAGNLIEVGREKRAILRVSEQQAALFAERYGAGLSRENLRLVRAYATISSLGAVARRVALFRHGFLLDGLVKKIGLIVLI